jgi:hypothetical protein
MLPFWVVRQPGISVIKTFITGIVIGIVAMIGVIHAVPVVDQYREPSLVSVTPNGGNFETFQIRVPDDRIMAGARNVAAMQPAGLLWPRSDAFDGVSAEMFKLRNSRGNVVGVANRLVAEDEEVGAIIEWVLHLPARGSIFATLDPQADGDFRAGDMRAGTREFEGLVGSVSERWIGSSAGDEDVSGRIELTATYVSTDFGEDATEAEEQAP